MSRRQADKMGVSVGTIAEHVVALSRVPFGAEALVAAGNALGWRFEDRSESAATPGGRLFEGQHGDAPQPLRISFDRERVLVVPLCALVGGTDLCEPEAEVSSFESLHQVYRQVRLALTSRLGQPFEEGQYRWRRAPDPFSFSVWRGERSTVALLEHHEGDAQVGHTASVEVRLYPLAEHPLRFPLETDILF